MQSKFKCLFNSIISEESEATKIKAAIADIGKTYGSAAETEVQKLFDIVNEYSEKLKTLKEDELKVPKSPNKPKSTNTKGMLNYSTKLQAYKNAMTSYWTKLEAFNQEKLDKISEIANTVDKYDIPKDGSCQLEYVLGNSKVGDDTIIINMGPATSCDAAKGKYCPLYLRGFCYAQNNESQHKLAIIKRFREHLQWRTGDGTVMATQLAAVIQNKRKNGKNVMYVRFNESGDMKDASDKKKLGKVVKETNEILTKNKQQPVVFYTYTHRTDLFPDRVNDIDDSKFLVIQGSGFFKDSGAGKKTPFYVDNCFMGIDYTNLVDLVRNGNFDQVTNPENDEGFLGVDFEGNKPNVVICRGACMKCKWCKTKGSKFLILCVYHGSGTKIKSASGQMTNRLSRLSKQLGALVTKYNLPIEIKRELYDVGHFNEYLIVDRLIGYAKHRDNKGYKEPIMDWDSIVPLMLDIREVAEADYKEAYKNWKESGKKIEFKPKLDIAGSKFSDKNDNKELKDYIAAARNNDDKFMAARAAGAKVLTPPEDIDPEGGWEAKEDDVLGVGEAFDRTVNDFMMFQEKSEETIPGLEAMSIDQIRNMAVANILVSHKDFVDPSTVQNLLKANNIDNDVIGDEYDFDTFLAKRDMDHLERDGMDDNTFANEQI